jgi:hypothetical protein
MVPRRDLCSSGYALAEPGRACIAYAEAPFTLDLSSAAGRHFESLWIDAEQGVAQPGGMVAGGGVARFVPPSARAALVLRRAGRAG